MLKQGPYFSLRLKPVFSNGRQLIESYDTKWTHSLSAQNQKTVSVPKDAATVRPLASKDNIRSATDKLKNGFQQ